MIAPVNLQKQISRLSRLTVYKKENTD